MFKIAVFRKSLTMLSIATMIVAFGGYTHSVGADGHYVTDGLEGYWPFDADTCDDGVAGSCADIAGGHDAEFNFPIKLIAGAVGDAVEFDGENGHFGLTNLLINSNEFPSVTMEAWANPYIEHEAWGSVLNGDDGGWDRGYGYRSTLWEIQVGKGGEWQPGAEATLNTWQHTVLMYTPDLVIFYKDGERYEFDEADPTESIQSMVIGDDIPCGPNCTFPGAIDEVRVYGRELTDAEVQQNYGGGTAVESAGKLAATWGDIKASR